MIKIKEYRRVKTAAEAYELCQKKTNVIIGGFTWLKMLKKNVNIAIDISDLGLDSIEEEDGMIKIGAQVTLRDLELSPLIEKVTGGGARDALKHIVGVQFRNSATVGGSIYGRYGFSDVCTLFLAMGAELEFYGAGRISLEEWLWGRSFRDRDLIMYIYIPSDSGRVAFRSIRNSDTDFAVLNCCVVRKGRRYRAAVGARPHRAVALTCEAADIVMPEEGKVKSECSESKPGKVECPENELRCSLSDSELVAFTDKIMEAALVGTNFRASEEYRSAMIPVLVKRAVRAAEGNQR